MNPSQRNPVVYALYMNAALLLAILAVLLARGHGILDSPAVAQQAPDLPIAGGGGIYVMPCQVHPEIWGCYLLDTQRQTLCVYEYRAGEKALVLSAARNFRYDLDLKNYNTFPAWYDIQKAVEDAAKNQQLNESQLPPVVPNNQPNGNP
jgi:hypothetical protein